MGRQIIVNGDAVELEREQQTADQLKRELGYDYQSVVIYKRNGSLIQINGNEPIPYDAQDVSIVPTHMYG
jgi:sulfur carrier protein ThiS